MRSIKTIIFLLVLTLIALFYYNHKHSYYGYTKSYFNQTPIYIRPHFRGPDLGNRGFCIVEGDFNLTVIGNRNRIPLNNNSYIKLNEILGYYFNKENLIVEGIDNKRDNYLILITYQNYKNNSFDLLKIVPENEGYKHIVIPKGKWTFYITNYLILFSFILVLILIYLLIKERKRRKMP